MKKSRSFFLMFFLLVSTLMVGQYDLANEIMESNQPIEDYSWGYVEIEMTIEIEWEISTTQTWEKHLSTISQRGNFEGNRLLPFSIKQMILSDTFMEGYTKPLPILTSTYSQVSTVIPVKNLELDVYSSRPKSFGPTYKL